MGNRVHGDSPGLAWCLIVATAVVALSDPVHAEGWNFHDERGRGDVICDAILKRLNSYQWTKQSALDERGLYVWSVVASYPGWKEPPWQELDPRDHRELVKELLKYRELSVFGVNKKHSDAWLASMEKSVERKMELDHRLRIWRTHLINWLDDRPAPPGDQPVVSLSFPFNAKELERLQAKYPDKPVVQRQGLVILATDDLRGPDPRLSEGIAERIGAVLLFDGKSHFVRTATTGRSVLIYRDATPGPRLFCSLEFDIAE